MPGTNALTIGQLGRVTATNVETIRYYERIGLLPVPARTAGNYRSYASDHARRLAFIRRARELGFSIEDVRELLDLAGHRENGTAPPFGRSRSSRPRMRRRPEPLKRLRPSGYDRCRKACGTNSASAWPALLSGVSLAARSMMGFGELA